MSAPVTKGAGFTLIEVLIAVLILGVASAMVLMNLRQADHRQLESDSQQIQSWVEDLRDRALLYGSVTGVYLDDGKLEATLWFDQNWWPMNQSKRPDLEPEFEVEFPLLEAEDEALAAEESPPEPGLVILPDGAFLAESRLIIRAPDGAAMHLVWDAEGEFSSELIR